MIIKGLKLEETQAINEIMSDFPSNADDLTIEFHQIEKGLSVIRRGNTGQVGYSTRASLLRGAVIAATRENTEEFETERFTFLGMMLDNSRNGVMTVAAIKKMCRLAARMGYNAIMLYMEDTYEIEEYPYFGYMRGRYTKEQLRECDGYAALLGIELIASIQTLAHLNAPLRWQQFSKVRDCNDILLVDQDETYHLIDSMLSSISSSLKSRRIHIGMDEAHMLGRGKYLDKNGYKPGFEIISKHLESVTELCNKYGYSPIIWSDMYFRMFSDDHGYCNTRTVIPDEVMKSVPKEITLCYWDYYDTDPEVYNCMIEKHRKFANPLMFAGGAWVWEGIVPLNKFSLTSGRAALKGAIESGVDEVMVTLWGDDGAEGSRFASMGTLQLYAEACWNGNIDDDSLTKRLTECAGITLEDTLLLSKPNYPPHRSDNGEEIHFPSKGLLFQDILCGILDRHTAIGDGLFYAETAKALRNAGEKNSQWSYIFDTVEALCHVLEIKAELGIRIYLAYGSGDRATLLTIAKTDIPELVKRIDALYECVRTQWLTEYKSFGLEIQAIRYGGLKQRVLETGRTLIDYLDGKRESLEELEQDRLYADGRNETANQQLICNYNNRWSEMISANVI